MARLSFGDRIRILLELKGGPQYSSGMKAAANATRAFGASGASASNQTARLANSTRNASNQLQNFQKRSFLVQQSLFTIRRLAFYATLALSGVFVGFIKSGFDFNNTMQQARILLKGYLGSTKAVNAELSKLFRIAVYSPYLLKDVVTATQIMIRLGVPVQQATQTVQGLSDALAGIPDSSAKLNRASLAIGHMMTIGRVTGQILTQLSRDNIPLVAALEQRYHLTGIQIQNISKLGIPAKDALQTLNTFLKNSPQYAGMAARISLQSLGGMLAAFRDFSSQTAGLLFKPLYGSIQNFMYGIIKPGGLLDKMSRAGQRGGSAAALAVISNYLGGGGVFAKTIMHTAGALKSLAIIFLHSFVPSLIIASRILGDILPVMKILDFLLGFLANHTTVLTVLLLPLAIVWMAVHSAMSLVWGMEKLLTIATFGLFKAEGELTAMEKLKVFWGNLSAARMAIWTAAQNLYTLATLGSLAAIRDWLFATKIAGLGGGFLNTGVVARAGRAVWGFAASLGGAAVAMRAFTVSVWANTVALVANPVVLVVGAIIALTTAVVVLYFKWKAFHDAVNKTARWFWTNWPQTVSLFSSILGPVGIMISLVGTLIKYFNVLKQGMDAVAGPFKWIATHLSPKGISYIPGPGGTLISVPNTNFSSRGGGGGGGIASDIWKAFNWGPKLHFQSGGIISGNTAWVGESGPELARFPAGTSIIPSATSNAFPAKTAPQGRQLVTAPIQLVMNRKIIAEIIAKTYADYQADK